MKQRPVLITGCSTGIGYFVAKSLSSAEYKAKGYTVVASCRQQADVERLQAEGICCIQLDLSCSRSIANGVEQLLQMTGGKLYGLFNNGAYGQPGAVEDLTREAIRQQFEVNLFGTMELTNLLLPVMRQQDCGRIIQNSSVLGLVAMKYRGAYNASKFALEGLTDTLRLELSDTHIQVSLIEPGPIVSSFRQNALTAFLRHIDVDASVHQQAYKATRSRLEKAGQSSRFTLGPEAVFTALIHALESKKAKARYYVTFPTTLFAWLRRILPIFVLDKILKRSA